MNMEGLTIQMKKKNVNSVLKKKQQVLDYWGCLDKMKTPHDLCLNCHHSRFDHTEKNEPIPCSYGGKGCGCMNFVEDEDKPIETMEELNEFFDNIALEQYDHEKRIKKLEENKK